VRYRGHTVGGIFGYMGRDLHCRQDLDEFCCVAANVQAQCDLCSVGSSLLCAVNHDLGRF